MGHKLDTNGDISLRDGHGQDASASPIDLSTTQEQWEAFAQWKGTKAAARALIRNLEQLVTREHLYQTIGNNGFVDAHEIKVEISGSNLVFSRPSANLVASVGGAIIEYTSNSISTALPSVSAGSVRYAQLSISTTWDVNFGSSFTEHNIPIARLYYDGTAWHLSDESDYPWTTTRSHELTEKLDQLQIITGGQANFDEDTDTDTAIEQFQILQALGFMNATIQRTVWDGANDWDYRQNISSGTRAIPVFARVSDGGGGYTWQNQGVQTNGVPFLTGGTPLPQYNNFLETLAEVGDGEFVSYFIFLTNNPQYPLVSIPANKKQASLEDARKFNLHGFYDSFGAETKPFSRMTCVCQVIVQGDTSLTNSYNALYREVVDYRYHRVGGWPYEPTIKSLKDRTDEDLFPQLALSRFVATAWPDDASPIDLSPEEKRILNFAFKTSGSFTFNLPDLTDVESGHTIFLFNAAAGGDVTVNAHAGNAILLPGTAGVTSMATSKYGSYCGFVGLTANNIWLVVDGNGEWVDDISTPTAKYNWDGNIAGGTDGNVVSVDAYGNIADSGKSHDQIGPIVDVSSNQTLTAADSGKRYFTNGGGSEPITFTLPNLSVAADSGVTYEFWGEIQDVLIVPTGTAIRMPWGNVSSTEGGIRCSAASASGGLPTRGGIRISWDLSSGAWHVESAWGAWFEANTPTKCAYYGGDSAYSRTVEVFDLMDDTTQSSSDPTASKVGEAWITDGWATKADGLLVVWDGSAWQTVHDLSSSQKIAVVINGSGVGSAAGSFSGHDGEIWWAAGYSSGVIWETMPQTAYRSVKVEGDSVYGKHVAVYDPTNGWQVVGGVPLATQDNFATFDADGRLQDSGVGAEIQVTCTDDATENIVLGAVATYRAFFLEFIMEDVGGTKAEAGTIMVMHFSSTAAENVDRTGVPSQLSGVTFGSDINSGNLRLNITLASVGSNVKFRYRVSRIELAA